MVEIWGLRKVDDHGHSMLAMLDLRAIEIDGICAVHSDLESRILRTSQLGFMVVFACNGFLWTYPFTSCHWLEARVHTTGQGLTWG